MDFDLTENQQALADLAERIFGDLATADRVAEVEATDDRFDRKLWGSLAEAGLVGMALPERDGALTSAWSRRAWSSNSKAAV